MTAQDVLALLGQRLGAPALLQSAVDPEDPARAQARVPADRIHDAAAALRGAGFDYLAFVTAVDHGRKLDLVYWFTNLAERLHVCVKCEPDAGSPVVASLCDLYATADWNEREVFDLFGVTFAGHPNLKRIVTWDGFEGHPLLKRYRVIDSGGGPAPEAPPAPAKPSANPAPAGGGAA